MSRAEASPGTRTTPFRAHILPRRFTRKDMRFPCPVLTSQGDSSEWCRGKEPIPLGKVLCLTHHLKTQTSSQFTRANKVLSVLDTKDMTSAQPRYKRLVATAIRTGALVATSSIHFENTPIQPPPSYATRYPPVHFWCRITIHVKIPPSLTSIYPINATPKTRIISHPTPKTLYIMKHKSKIPPM